MIAGFFSAWIVYALVLLLHLVLPARQVDGYVRDASGRLLRYRLNGLRVMVLTIALWAAACKWAGLPWDWFWTHRWEGLAGACVIGLVFTAAIVLPAAPVRGFAADLFLGRRANPQLGDGRVDAKMYLYLIGAIMLELNVLSFAAHHVIEHSGHGSPGVYLYAAMFTFFATEYLYFEQVHLYTYDFVAERVGFKLGWGCMVFYPYFYCIGLWSEAPQSDAGTHPALLACCALCFVSGWMLSRGANMQKYWFKTRPGAKFLGRISPETISDGSREVLCNGFWGLSRHVNYLGEILMAVGLTLSLGRALDPWPWLYPLYYVALLFPRQAADDRRCAAKYGELWKEYVRRVPWRIIPGVY
ncbi:MAG: DUF1295 domain-containing protein [Deltaproteobacteria bacterium]|nr:DUF1295 domain-containing protein [Deltaproteobacteria bacterium]